MITISSYTNSYDKTGETTDLDSVINRIKQDDDLKQKTEKCRELISTSEDNYKKYKESQLPAVTFSGKFKQRKVAGLQQHSGLVVLDVDDIENIPQVMGKLTALKYVCVAFISPSGNGIKAVCKVDPAPKNDAEHKIAYSALVSKIKEINDIDTSGSDVSRLCYLCHDEKVFYNPDTCIPFTYNLATQPTDNTKPPAYTQQSQIDISILDFINPDEDYDIWKDVGMAIKDEGLDFSVWDNWSRKGTKYKESKMQSKWDSFKGQGIRWGTVVHLAKQNGWQPQTKHNNKSQNSNTQDNKTESTFEFMNGITGDDLDDMDFPEPNWVVDDFIPEGLTLIAGAPKIGKSFFCWNLTLAVTQGGIFMSEYEVSQPKTVLCFALEDPLRQIKSRLKMIQPDERLPRNMIVYPTFPIQLAGDGLDTWRKVIEDNEAEVVIIDTMHHVLPQMTMGTAYQQDYTLLAPIRKMVHDMGISMVLVTHTRKMSDYDNPFNMIQGSVGMQAGSDTMMMLINKDGQKELHIKGREIMEQQLHVELNDGVFVILSEDEVLDEKLSETRMHIREALKEAGHNGLTQKDIVDAVKSKTSEASIKRTLRRMAEEEQIYQPKKRGKYYYKKPENEQTDIESVGF